MDAIIIAVAHDDFMDIDFSGILAANGVIIDVKGFLKEIPKGYHYWRL